MVEAHHENIRATTAGTPPVAVPVSGMALLLIDVINDLAFDGSEALVAHAESTAAPLARLKHRATAVGVPTIHINDTSGSGALIFAAPSSIAPHALLQVTRVEASPPTARDYFVLKPKHSGFFGEIPPHARAESDLSSQGARPHLACLQGRQADVTKPQIGDVLLRGDMTHVSNGRRDHPPHPCDVYSDAGCGDRNSAPAWRFRDLAAIAR